MQWRFGGDLGSNSLGWCAVELGPNRTPWCIIAIGTRIFSDGRDPNSKQSLAVNRRDARAMRRRRDRFKQRQAALLKHLTLAGLFPPETDAPARAALQALDPFALRARALHEALAPHEIGRALFHINQRRGFKSNRRTDRKADTDKGKIRIGIQRLQAEMAQAGAATFGEFLHLRRAAATDANHIPSVRTRLRPETGPDAQGDGYDFYPDRALLEEEFDAIITAQAPHHPTLLRETTRETLFDVIFHQRPLKSPRIGMCTLVAGEERLPKAHPLFQRRRLLEEVNALRIVLPGQIAQPLTLDQRNLLLLKLQGKKTVTFESLRRALRHLDPAARFNKESENRKELKGDEIVYLMSNKKRFGTKWSPLPPDAQWEVIRRIRDTQSDIGTAELRSWLHTQHGLTPEQADAVIDAPLPEGFGRFGATATQKLIDALQAEIIVYSVAVERAGLGHHSDMRGNESWDALPYYGQVLERHILPGSGDPNDTPEERYGRITNPTVHIGLNQLRLVLNRLIKTYGKPAEIALEIARELKLDDKRKKEIESRNKQNKEAAELRSKKLVEMGIADKGANRVILKLWEELNPENILDRRCIYSGRQITAEMLFTGAVEIEHILPFSDSLDPSQANLLLSLREANRAKRKQSPYDAFGHTESWADIVVRAARLPREKRWRFEPDAMARFKAERDFLARQLNDTAYLSRLAREYVSTLYPEREEATSHVWVSPGRLTEMLRRSWGLNSLLSHNAPGGADPSKNRADHRHHAIDALVVAVTDRGLLQRIAREAGQRGHEAADRLTASLPTPWEDFRDDTRAAIQNLVTSHRPDHGTASKAGCAKGKDTTAGRLHNDTAYGLTGHQENGNDLVVHRIALQDLKPQDLQEGKRRIADPTLRAALAEATAGQHDKDFTRALIRFAQTHPQFNGIRHVRVLEPLSVIPIHDAQGRAYKAYKGDANFRFDVWETREGKWIAETVSMFEAHQPGWRSRIHAENHNARKVLSLKADDLLAMDGPDGRALLRVVKFSDGQLVLAAPNEAGDLKRRHGAPDDRFRYVFVSASRLKAESARQVRIDELGRIQDPGPRSKPPAPPAA